MNNKKIISALMSISVASYFLMPSYMTFASDTVSDYKNLISNDTFDTSINNWYKYTAGGASATISQSDGQLMLDISDVGSLNYGVQAYYDILPLYQNGVYRLRFDISSNVDRFVECMLQQNGGDYTAYNWEGINLVANETQTIDVTFTMDYETDFLSRLVFNCGDQAGDGDNSPHKIYLDNVYLELIDDTNVDYNQFIEEEESIITNQVGYLPDSNKVAIFRGEDITDTTFNVVNANTSEVVYTGEMYNQQYSLIADETDYYGDFSSITQDGTYYIQTSELEPSYTFTISSNAYDDLLNSTLKMFYLQRCGSEVIDDNAGHTECHTSLATIYGTDETIDVSGGWHDAGDYGRYIVAGAKTVADLLLAYDNNADIFTDNVGIPESGNGIPDVLDEARYELEWMLKMQDTSTGGVYHKVTCKDFPAYEMPQYETAELLVTPVSTTATATFCATMAMAYEYYKDIDEDFSQTCLDRAKLAYQFLQDNPNIIFKNPEDITTGAYSDSSDKDERYWAAAQMFKATGDQKYLQDFESTASSTVYTGLDWNSVGTYANIAYLSSNSDLKDTAIVEKITTYMLKKSSSLISTGEINAYNVTLSKFNWGSNMTIANNGIELYYVSSFTEDNSNIVNYANEQLNYLLGKNPVATCYVTGFGTVSPENPHHRPSMKSEHAVEGMLVGGANQNLEDSPAKAFLSNSAPAKCWIDNAESYSTNEITIYWNSPLIYLLSYSMKDVSSNNNAQVGDVNNDGKVNSSDLLILKKYLLGLIDTIDNADMNNDNNISMADLLTLKKHLLGL